MYQGPGHSETRADSGGCQGGLLSGATGGAGARRIGPFGGVGLRGRRESHDEVIDPAERDADEEVAAGEALVRQLETILGATGREAARAAQIADGTEQREVGVKKVRIHRDGQGAGEPGMRIEDAGETMLGEAIGRNVMKGAIAGGDRGHDAVKRSVGRRREATRA